jgi:hypothetical protein
VKQPGGPDGRLDSPHLQGRAEQDDRPVPHPPIAHPTLATRRDPPRSEVGDTGATRRVLRAAQAHSGDRRARRRVACPGAGCGQVVGELDGQVVGVLLRSARRPAAQPPSIFLTRSHNENCAALAGVGFAGGGVTDGCSPLSCSDARGGSRTARIRAAVPRCAGSVQGHLSGVLLHHPVVVVVL